MLEDALGLKAYQYKIEESERKLEKTDENMRQVAALRKEIAPHLRFLKKQVEKVEKARELKASAALRFKQYFKNEEAYLAGAKGRLEKELSSKKGELSAIAAKVADAKKALAGAEGDKRAAGILDLSRALDEARAMRADAARKTARLEGQIEALEKTAVKASVSSSDISRILDDSEGGLSALEKGNLEGAVAFVRGLIEKLRTLVKSARESGGDLGTLMQEKDRLLSAEKEGAKKEAELSASLENIRKELEDARLKEREKERALFELASEEREARHAIENLTNEEERLSLVEAEFKRDLAEAAPLVGREAVMYADMAAEASATRETQEREKRELEKIKIRLEEMGAAGGEDMMKEYREATEREAFLEKELADLEAAKEQLKTLIENLKQELSGRFASGIESINKEFSRLFAVMFDGGTASLVKTKEAVRKPALLLSDEEGEEPAEEPAGKKEDFVEGIDIALSIPRKRVKSLVMLSGGERALTSIALIFAMSSVNPPPFLILDETDAALDEANSRRYGDMVSTLSEKSQLIVITHNRETMSRAGILYGVTMGNDGVSKVLSVKLEDAVRVAK